MNENPAVDWQTQTSALCVTKKETLSKVTLVFFVRILFILTYLWKETTEMKISVRKSGGHSERRATRDQRGMAKCEIRVREQLNIEVNLTTNPS